MIKNNKKIEIIENSGLANTEAPGIKKINKQSEADLSNQTSPKIQDLPGLIPDPVGRVVSAESARVSRDILDLLTSLRTSRRLAWSAPSSCNLFYSAPAQPHPSSGRGVLGSRLSQRAAPSGIWGR